MAYAADSGGNYLAILHGTHKLGRNESGLDSPHDEYAKPLRNPAESGASPLLANQDVPF